MDAISTVSLLRKASTLAERIIKVNHAGEFGAVNIYRAQILVARFTAPAIVPTLREFFEHECRHLQTFHNYLSGRKIRRCKSFLLCGAGGYFLGFVTALIGRNGVMACTAAVETVVTEHLSHQIDQLREAREFDALIAVESILMDELAHQAAGVAQSKDSLLYRPLSSLVSWATRSVIWLGMRL